MNHVLSTHLCVQHRLTVAMLDRILHAGIPAVEIFCAKQHLDYRDQPQIRELGHWFRDAALKLQSVHSPMYNDDVWGRSGPQSVISITEPVKSKRIAVVDEIKRAIEIAEYIPFTYLVQHLGVTGEEYDDRKIDSAFASLEEISLFARQRGVNLILENTQNALASSERLMMFLGQTHLDLGFCFDVGHAHMNEGVENAYRVMKSRIRSVHIHDNDGKQDLHLFPFAAEGGGTINWASTMDLLRSEPAQYPLVLELKEVPGMTNQLDVVRSVFDRLETITVEDRR